jgi:hypothetical protein
MRCKLQNIWWKKDWCRNGKKSKFKGNRSTKDNLTQRRKDAKFFSSRKIEGIRTIKSNLPQRIKRKVTQRFQRQKKLTNHRDLMQAITN